MNTGTCYVFDSNDSIVAFPLLDCVNGDTLQLDSPTSATYYTIYGGRVFKVREAVVDSTDFGVGLTLHTWPNNNNYFLDMNFGLLAATAFIIAFFVILFHWFIRLRG